MSRWSERRAAERRAQDEAAEAETRARQAAADAKRRFWEELDRTGRVEVATPAIVQSGGYYDHNGHAGSWFVPAVPVPAGTWRVIARGKDMTALSVTYEHTTGSKEGVVVVLRDSDLERIARAA